MKTETINRYEIELFSDGIKVGLSQSADISESLTDYYKEVDIQLGWSTLRLGEIPYIIDVLIHCSVVERDVDEDEPWVVFNERVLSTTLKRFDDCKTIIPKTALGHSGILMLDYLNVKKTTKRE